MSALIVSVSGIRGIVGESLFLDTALGYAAVLGESLTASHGTGCRVLIASDGRQSGEALRHATAAGLAGQGCQVIDLGVVPTPTVGVAVRAYGGAGAIQVTASHNPSPYNGLKLFHHEGRVFPAAPGKVLADRFQSAIPRIRAWDRCGRVQTPHQLGLADPIDLHVAAALKLIAPEAIRKRKFRILVDANGGSGGPAVCKLLKALGVETVPVGCITDGNFLHEPEPTAENLKGLASTIAREKVDLALVVDPDCDRLALLDASGHFIGEEYTLALGVWQCLLAEPGPVVINLSTSSLTAEAAKRAGVPLHRSPVGEANVVDMMKETKASIGGEGNGGLIDPRIGWVRDPLAGAVRILDLLARTGQTLGQLVKELPPFAIVKKKLHLDRAGVEPLAALVEKALPGSVVDRRDGIRLDWDDRWVQLRASNTEPIVRVIAEAKGLEAAEALAQKVIDLAHAKGR